jgi:2-C-methyl-D-erythritol 4-phosphate cytidylyltransferase/2-C-methyl-D-erythritol 2,4-cyclodiphosphate synthase
VAAVRATDTVKRGDAEGRVIETLPREHVYLAQTPQAFRVGVLRDALALTADATDEAALAERARPSVRLVEGEPSNVKITTPGDLSAAERVMAAGAPSIRIGQGYDLHRLVPGRPLVLGGVTIAFDLGLSGHSDADIVCHAVTDAVLGAAGLGDIGRHFPDSDARWKAPTAWRCCRGLRARPRRRLLGGERGRDGDCRAARSWRPTPTPCAPTSPARSDARRRR